MSGPHRAAKRGVTFQRMAHNADEFMHKYPFTRMMLVDTHESLATDAFMTWEPGNLRRERLKTREVSYHEFRRLYEEAKTVVEMSH